MRARQRVGVGPHASKKCLVVEARFVACVCDDLFQKCYRLFVRLLPLLVVATIGLSCGSPAAPDVPAGAVRVTGVVHFYSLEGGFWAVRGDDGVIYDPMNGLPTAFQRENLRVTMIVNIRSDVGGIHMVGPIVEILQIEAI